MASAARVGRDGILRLARAAWGRLRRIPRPVLFFIGTTAALFLVAAIVVVLYFSRVVSRTMDGRRWSLPTRLYSDVWAVRAGDTLSADDIVRRLARLRYAEVPKAPVAAGQYARVKGRILVTLNARETAWGRSPGVAAEIEFSGRRVAALKRADDGTPLPYVVFEPEIVGSVYDEKMQDRTLVMIDQIPPVVLDAILTTEDRDFFTHGGISFRRLVGAVLQGATRGAAVRGTSTLTQQLVKNMFLTPERKLKRKVVEALMAVILEAKYSKKEILEAYLNEIYLGQRGSISVTGVEEAARFYFGKGVSRLDLPEAAMLAGLISSPGKYSPYRNPENARARRALVLKGMLEQKKIGKAAYEAALAAPLTKSKGPPSGIVAPHFVDFVLKQVKEAPGFVKEDGLSVYTTLDPDMQQAAQAAVLKGLEELEKRFKRLRPRGDDDALQAAVIALDPATGSVRALVGGRDYQVSQFNRVVQARRQPGSLFKPFVYLTAFGKRDLPKPITPASIFVDSPIALVWGKGEDETWSPKNYDGEFRGPMTARQALEQSINIPTVRIAVTETAPGRTLLPDIVSMARRAGISSTLRPYPSLALGSFETSPMEIAAAYCTFANGGFRVRPNALLGIVGANARRIETKNEPVVRGVDADAISILDSVLRGVVDRGTGGSARRLGAQGIFAGKTGTTNDGRDAWFVGFSPRLLVAVWVGFDDNRGLNLSGSSAALPIFADFVRRLPSQYFETPFPSTPGVITRSIDPTTGLLVTEECPKSFDEVFLEGTQPTERCNAHGGGTPGPGVAGEAP